MKRIIIHNGHNGNIGNVVDQNNNWKRTPSLPFELLSYNNAPPLLDYLAYLRQVDFKKVYKATRFWLNLPKKSMEEPFGISVKRRQINQANAIVKELGILFLNFAQINNLTIDIRDFDYDLATDIHDCISWPTYPLLNRNSYYNSSNENIEINDENIERDNSTITVNNTHNASNEVVLRSEIREFLCAGQFDKDKILEEMTPICKDIEILSLHDSSGTSSDSLANFIMVQKRLKKFILTDWHLNTQNIFSAIATQSKTLKHFEIINCNLPIRVVDKINEYKDWLFENLTKCHKLEFLKIEKCRNLSSIVMEPLAKVGLKNLKVLIIDNYINDYNDDDWDWNSITGDQELKNLIRLFERSLLKKLVELRIQRKKETFSNTALRSTSTHSTVFEVKQSLIELGNSLPSSIKYIELNSMMFNYKSWEEFLNVCPTSIEHLAFNTMQDQTKYKNLIEKYAKKHDKRLKCKDLSEYSWLSPKYIMVDLF
ncbi:5343_t:CDS:2 [Entrophospora sp. SA101]|nr:5343_t:CDS:2 [Entrophospora sp. SA101]CAJ0926202.1 18292_t:CDS:2 [Entrophospora sp. SA101]